MSSVGQTSSQWFIDGDGIDRTVISTQIRRYLGNDATVRPGVGTGQYQGVQGFWIKAYRNLTTAMIADLRAHSQRRRREQQRTGSEDMYVGSRRFSQDTATRHDQTFASGPEQYGQSDSYGQPSNFARIPSDPYKPFDYALTDYPHPHERYSTPNPQISEYSIPSPALTDPGAPTQAGETSSQHAAWAAENGGSGDKQNGPLEQQGVSSPQRSSQLDSYAYRSPVHHQVPSYDLSLQSWYDRRRRDRHGPERRPPAPAARQFRLASDPLTGNVRSGEHFDLDPSAQTTRRHVAVAEPPQISDVEYSPQATPSREYDDLCDFADALQRRTITLLRLLRYASRAARSRGTGPDRSNNHNGGNSEGPSDSSAGRRPKRTNEDREDYNGQPRDESYGPGGEGNGGKRQRRDSGDNGDGDSKKLLPCVFKVHDSVIFERCNSFSFISRLQKHLAGKHKVYACSDCLIKFDNEKGLSLHKHDKKCTTKTCWRRLPRGLDLFGPCDCLVTAERRWLGLFHLCFPEDAVPLIFGDPQGTFPKLLGEMITFNEAALLDHDYEPHFDDYPTNNINLDSFLDPRPHGGVMNDTGEQSFVDRASQRPECSAHTDRDQLANLYAQISDLRGAIEQLHSSLDAERKANANYQKLSGEAKKLEKRVIEAEQEVKQSRIAKEVLQYAWTRFKASGHQEAKDGEALDRLIAALPRRTNGSSRTVSSSDRASSSNREVEDYSSPRTQLSDWREDLDLHEEVFEFEFDDAS